MIGRTVSHYRIVDQLGAGGMGVVYAAEDDRLGRPVALKFVPDDLAQDLQAVDRLRSEARTASGLNHPNICTIYDIGDDEGRPFIAMELLKGQTLRDRLAAGPLKIHDAVELGIQVADALDSAHERNIIHRDIKPANLFVAERGHVKILDFGLAKLVQPEAGAMTTAGFTRDQTVEGVTLGTVSYMSPEQVMGEALDARTDLFSLGVVLYECLTGHQPFTGKTSAMVFSAILTQAPVAPVVFTPELPLRLQEVVNNCLEKDRELRYQNAAGLRADLKRVKRDLESGRSGVFRIASGSTMTPTSAHAPAAPKADSAPRASVDSSAATPNGKRPLLIAAGLGAAALAVALIVAASFSRSRTQPPAERAVSPPAPAPIQAATPAQAPLASTPAQTPAPAPLPEPPARGAQTRPLPAAPPPSTTSTAQPAKRESPRAQPSPASPAPVPAPAAVPPPATLTPPAAPPPVLVTPPTPFVSTPEPPPQSAPAPKPPEVAAPERREAPAPAASAPPARTPESDEPAIRRIVATYARAIETKDIALFRSVKPNMSAEEQRRVEDGFRAVTSQEVAITILAIEIRGQDAAVRLQRRDTIQAGGRRQTAESQQTMMLTRTASGWVIREIGR